MKELYLAVLENQNHDDHQGMLMGLKQDYLFLHSSSHESRMIERRMVKSRHSLAESFQAQKPDARRQQKRLLAETERIIQKFGLTVFSYLYPEDIIEHTHQLN